MLKVNISQLHGLHIPFYHSNQSAASFVHTSSEKSLAYIIKNWRKYILSSPRAFPLGQFFCKARTSDIGGGFATFDLRSEPLVECGQI